MFNGITVNIKRITKFFYKIVCTCLFVALNTLTRTPDHIHITYKIHILNLKKLLFDEMYSLKKYHVYEYKTHKWMNINRKVLLLVKLQHILLKFDTY